MVIECGTFPLSASSPISVNGASVSESAFDRRGILRRAVAGVRGGMAGERVNEAGGGCGVSLSGGWGLSLGLRGRASGGQMREVVLTPWGVEAWTLLQPHRNFQLFVGLA